MNGKAVWTTIILCTAIIVASNQVRAGAWAQKKNGLFFKTSFNYLFTRSEFNYLGNKQPISFEREGREDATFRDANITFYLEYGLTERFTGIVNLPVKALTADWVDIYGGQRLGWSHSAAGPGDLSVGLRFPFFDGPFVLSVQSMVKIPLGYEGPEVTDKESPPLGSAEIDFDAQLLLGKSLYPLPIYVTGGAGYRVRGGIFNDEYFYSGEIGYQQGKLLIKLVLDGIINTVEPQDLVGAPRASPEPGGGGDFSKIIGDQNIVKISPGFFYYLKPWLAVSGEVFHTLTGKNTISGTTYSVGFILQ